MSEPLGFEEARALVRKVGLRSVAEWEAWARSYTQRVAAEARPADERRAEMDGANPKFILRNWMAAEAYEAAARGDSTVVDELLEVLRRPYDEQTPERSESYAQPTPRWARGKFGLETMS